MRKKLIVPVLLCLMTLQLTAQEKPQYAVSLIPDSLKRNANAVLREYTQNLVITKPGKGKQITKKVVTAFNEKAEPYLEFQEYMDRFHKISDVEINLYDQNGVYIKRYKKKDLEKFATEDGISLVTDGKLLYGAIRSDKYPMTVEYNYSVSFEGFLEYDDFYPQEVGQSIQQSSYSITIDKENPVRYKNYRCQILPEIKEDGNKLTYTWSVKNVKPYQMEPGSARGDVPKVIIAPTYFEMDDYPGNMSSWESFGKWRASLIGQTNQLPKERVAFYRDLVKNSRSDREKVAILYKHLQENFRYVSIQFGIGGWKPFPADFVESKKYGDCKALSNFMQAMLSAVDINSHYAVINAGHDQMPVDKEFPQNAFNHVILCVPLPSDTIWLECTSRTQPFGVLGNFTENRNAFLIKETGGVIVPTPRSKPEHNTLSTISQIQLQEDGSGKASVEITPKGEFTDLIERYIVQADEQRKKSYLINTAGFKQPDVLQVSKKNSTENFTVKMDMEIEKVPDFSAGSKHFLNARIYKFWDDPLPKTENRQNDYYLDFPLIQTDSTIYQLPEGYTVESMPKPASISFDLGSFSSDYVFDTQKNRLITTCRIQIDKHVIPAKIYMQAAKFFSDVIKEQQQKIVIKKQ
jgi:hypothetical protein